MPKFLCLVSRALHWDSTCRGIKIATTGVARVRIRVKIHSPEGERSEFIAEGSLTQNTHIHTYIHCTAGLGLAKYVAPVGKLCQIGASRLIVALNFRIPEERDWGERSRSWPEVTTFGYPLRKGQVLMYVCDIYRGILS